MERQRILVLTERFAPEEFLVNDLVREWRDRGHAVEVLTQVPSYPHDRIFDGYRNRLFQTTRELDGIPVHRVRTVLGYNARVGRKILNYLSFAALTTAWALVRGGRYDRVFVCHTGPLTMATAALALRFVWRRPCAIWTQDLWPDAVYAYGFRRTPLRAALLNGFVRLVYSACRPVFVSCPGFVEPLARRIRKPVAFVPQWDVGGAELPPKAPSGKLIFMFTGNHGVPQILDRVVAGFAAAKIPDAELHLVGGGVKLEELKRLVAEKGVAGVVFHGRQPQRTMPDFLARADVLVLPLAAAFSLTLPGKFPAYLKAGRPILGIIAGAAAELIAREDLGLVADPEDVDDIRRAFARFAALLRGDPAAAGRFRDNALRLSRGQFSRAVSIDRLGMGEEAQ